MEKYYPRQLKFNYTSLKDNKNNTITLYTPDKIGTSILTYGYYNISSKNGFGIKDLFIYKNKIYISYTNQVKKDCYNTSILVSDLNLKKLKFENFFTPDPCLWDNEKNEYGEFIAVQAGGRMFSFKNNL